MRYLKYLRYLCLILIVCATVFSSVEFYQLYLYDFDNFINTSFYINEKTNLDTFKTDVFEADETYNVDVFYIDKTFQGEYKYIVEIYADSNIQEMIKDEYLIEEGVFKSFFCGESVVEFKSIDEIDLSTIKNNPDGFFIYGDYKDACKYKASLVDTYGGHVPYEVEGDKIRDIKMKYAIIWTIALLLIVGITYWHTIRIRKEALIRLSLGQSLKRYVIKEFMVDAIICTVAFFIASVILKKIMGRLFLYECSCVFFAFVLIGMFIVYLVLSFGNYKLAFSNHKVSQKILDVAICAKMMLSIALVFSATSLFAVITNYFELSKQKMFYEERANKVYVTFDENEEKEADGDEQINISAEFYKKYYDRLNIEYTSGDTQYGDYNDNKVLVRMNGNMLSYLVSVFPEQENRIVQSEACILIPKDIELSPEEWVSVLDGNISNFSTVNSKDDVEIIYYDKGKSIINYDLVNGYNLRNNAIIFFQNSFNPTENFEFDGAYNVCMMDYDKDILDDFCQEYNCTYIVQNVYADFESTYLNCKRGFLVSGVVFLILLISWISIDLSVIKLEFEVHRMELILKKIMGTKFTKRISGIILYTLVPSIVGALIVYGFLVNSGVTYRGKILCFIAVQLLLQVLCVLVNFLRAENANYQKILKGGIL